VEANGLSTRAEVTLGDLREVTAGWTHPRCELVTGTPPYLPLGTALPSPDPQRAAARIELRGGVEDYLAAAARVLAPAGRVVVCADGRYPGRVIEGARAAHLAPIARLDVFARAAARAPLFAVWTLAHAAEDPPPLVHQTLAMRDEAGERTEAGRALRRDFGLA
jgi:tRNA1Val (adenine37-N6)-methyltransferase